MRARSCSLLLLIPDLIVNQFVRGPGITAKLMRHVAGLIYGAPRRAGTEREEEVRRGAHRDKRGYWGMEIYEPGFVERVTSENR